MYFQFTKLQYAHKGAQHFMLFSVFDVTGQPHYNAIFAVQGNNPCYNEVIYNRQITIQQNNHFGSHDMAVFN